MDKQLNWKVALTISILLASLLALGQGQNNKYSELFDNKKYEEIISLAQEDIKSYPSDPQINLFLGSALVEKGRYEESIIYLEKVLYLNKKKSWHKAWALNYLGIGYYMLGDKHKARCALIESYELNGTKNSKDKAKNLLIVFGLDEYFNNWEVKETKNIRFHFEPDIKMDKVEFVTRREAAFSQINSYFNVTLRRKIDFYVWNYMEGAQKIGIQYLGFSSPKYFVIFSYKDQSAGHEIAHVLTYFFFDKTQPTEFLSEGLAVYFNQNSENKLRNAKKAIINESQIKYKSVKDIWINWANYPRNLAYPVSGAFVEYLINTCGFEYFKNIYSYGTYEIIKKETGSRIDSLIYKFDVQITSDIH